MTTIRYTGNRTSKYTLNYIYINIKYCQNGLCLKIERRTSWSMDSREFDIETSSRLLEMRRASILVELAVNGNWLLEICSTTGSSLSIVARTGNSPPRNAVSKSTGWVMYRHVYYSLVLCGRYTVLCCRVTDACVQCLCLKLLLYKNALAQVYDFTKYY